jgi:hypothetical protein
LGWYATLKQHSSRRYNLLIPDAESLVCQRCELFADLRQYTCYFGDRTLG